MDISTLVSLFVLFWPSIMFVVQWLMWMLCVCDSSNPHNNSHVKWLWEVNSPHGDLFSDLLVVSFAYYSLL